MKMYDVYWEIDGGAPTNAGHRAGPFETRAAAERFAIALPQTINPAKDRLVSVRVDAVEVEA